MISGFLVQDCDRPDSSGMEYEQPPPSHQEDQKPAVMACADEPGNVGFDYDEVEQSAVEIKVI